MSNGNPLENLLPRGQGLGLLLVVLVIGLFAPQVGSVRRQTTIGATPVAREEKATGGPLVYKDNSDALQLLQDFAQASAAASPSALFPQQPAPAGATDLQATYQLLTQNAIDVEFVVATIADPIDSHLPLSFDLCLAAMQRAIERHGFVLDRYSLPWREELQTGDAKSTITSDARHVRQPGVVVCRKVRAEPAEPPPRIELLVLLLVGETPTTGVHKPAFTSALDLAAAWQLTEQLHQPEASVHVPVLGPTFSGSTISLRQALLNWGAASSILSTASHHLQRVNVELISGSATAVNPELFTSIRPPRLNVTFHATVVPDSVALQHVLKHLVEERGIPAPDIALLVEGNTDYGARQLKDSDSKDLSQEILYLPFPAELSRLRTEYEKADSTQKLEQPQVSTPANVDIPQQPNPFARDALPRFSPAIAPVADLTLESLLGTLDRCGVRAVGLLGTNPLDLQFLAQQIRSHTSGVQLFALEGNVLFYHSKFREDFEGMLVVGTYPLFVVNQDWTGRTERKHQYLQFPNSTTEGVYNAMLALLNRKHDYVPLLEYSYPLREPADATPAQINSGPPLWLSMVGSSGFWPVRPICWWDEANSDERAYIWRPQAPQDADSPAPAVATKSAFMAVDPPSSIGAVFFSLFSASVVVVFVLTNNRPTRRLPFQHAVRKACRSLSLHQQARNGIARRAVAAILVAHKAVEAAYTRIRRAVRKTCRWLSLDDPDIPPHPHQQLRERTRRRAVLALFGALTVAQAALVYPITLYLLERIDSPWGLAWRWLATSLISILSLFLLLALTAKLTRAVLSRKLFTLTLSPLDALLFVGLVAGLAALLTLQLEISTPGMRASLIERVGTWSSGVTPITPIVLLAAAVGVWGVGHLLRLYYLTIFWPESPFPGAGGGLPTGSCAGIQSRINELQSRLSRTWVLPVEWLDWVFLGSLAVVSCYVFLWRWIPTAENMWLDWLAFRIGIVVVLVLIGGSQIRLKATCNLFERLLRRLSQHAIVDAFDQVPPRLANKVANQIFAAAPHPGDLELAVGSITALSSSGLSQGIWIDGGAAVNVLATNYATLAQLRRADQQDELLLAAELNQKLCQIACQHIVPRLLPVWRTRRLQPISAGTSGGAGTATWQDAAGVFLAMQLTMLFRQAFKQIQTMMTCLGIMLLCLLWALNSYPFQPATTLGLLCYGLVGWVVLTFVIAVIRFNRSEVMSRLARTTPNRFTWDRSLILPITTYVVIPVLSLIAMQVPGVGRFLFDWIGVLQRALQA